MADEDAVEKLDEKIEENDSASDTGADDDRALKRDVPAYVMLGAGLVVCIACMLLQVNFTMTLAFVLSTLVVFFIVGKVISTVIRRMDFHNAKLREAEADFKKEEARKLKEKEEAEAEKDADDSDADGEPDSRVTVGRSVSGKI